MKTVGRAFLIVALAGCGSGFPNIVEDSISQNRQARVTAVATPNDAVCRLQLTRSKLLWFDATPFSSGAHIGNGIILTAAHNLYSPFYNEVSTASAECGVADHVDGAGSVVGFTKASISVASGYRWGPYARDVAILRVPNPPATAFDVAPDDLDLTVGDTVSISGFPGEGYTTQGESLHTGTGRIVALNKEFITYEIETTTGNSGGPVWIRQAGKYILVGVHVAGAGYTGTARRITKSFVDGL